MSSVLRAKHRALTGWLAALAILIQALAPVYAMAQAPAGAALHVPVCAAMGGMAMPAPMAPSHGPDKPQHSHPCPFCAVHATAAAVPAPATVPLSSGLILCDRGIPPAAAAGLGHRPPSHPIRAPPSLA